MKTRGFWLRRQQMRWLIVLLALLPLVPTGIIVRDLIQATGDEHEAAIAMVRYGERTQLNSIARRLSRNPAGPETAGELAEALKRIFGQESVVEVVMPGDSHEAAIVTQYGDGAMVVEIPEGRLADWKVALYHEIEAPWFLLEQTRNRWWQAVGVMGIVTLIAFSIWWAISRGLRVDELRSDLLATVAHEMKTPLSSMRVLLETLSAGTIADPEKQREYLDLLQRENARLSRLTEDFLTFGRLERGEIRLKREVVVVDSLAADAIEELGPAVAAVTAEIRTEIEPGLTALADRDGLFAVITNLVENSLKYGGDHPAIDISASREGETVTLSVADSGPGIPRELRKSVFRRYFRIDRALSEKGSGVGLGLAICRQLVRKMGGGIRAEAAGAGERGLRVVVTLPAGKTHEGEARSGSAETLNLQPEPIAHAQSVDR